MMYDCRLTAGINKCWLLKEIFIPWLLSKKVKLFAAVIVKKLK